jgi:acetylornithine deacetylase/succinyl-diaminopimelate desuccinylase-like protein
VRYLIEISGTASHAGTSPMHQRHDAVAGFAAFAVYVEELRRVGTTLEIRGRLVNQSATQLHVAVQNFTFVDAAGIRYGVAGPTSILEPAAVEPFAFTVPVPPSRVLTMTLVLAPDPPLVLTLLQESVQP